MKQFTNATDIEKGKLLKILGVTFGLAITIGGMIGLGILRTPGTVAAQLGSVWLILAAWTLGGIYALFGTLQAAELATAIPKTGGIYVFAKRAFGMYGGFVVGWMDWISYPAGMALAALIVGEYFSVLFPAAPDTRFTALLVLLGLGIINALGLRVGSRIQEITSFSKAAVFLILIAGCFIFGDAPLTSSDSVAVVETPVGALAIIGAFVIALQGIIYAYDGWYSAVYFTEENKDPSRSLPRAMIAGVLAVMAIYLLFNLALLYVLPVADLAASTLPAAEAATVVLGQFGNKTVTILAVVSLLSIMNANMLMGPRILFGMGRDGLFSSKAAWVNKGGTPIVSLALTLLAAVPLIIIGSFEKLLAISAFLYIAIYMSAFLAVFVLRRTEPDLARPFKAWGYPWTTLIALVGSLAFLIGAVINDTENSIYALGLIVISYPVYLLIARVIRNSPSDLA